MYRPWVVMQQQGCEQNAGGTKQPLSVVAAGGVKRENSPGTAEAAGCYYYTGGNVWMQCLPGRRVTASPKKQANRTIPELRLAAEQLSTDWKSKIAPDCCHFLSNQSIQLWHQISRCVRPWDNSTLTTRESPGRWSHSNTMTLRLRVDDEGRKWS
jgi:hypothetical protein